MFPRFVMAASCFLGYFLQACVADHPSMIVAATQSFKWPINSLQGTEGHPVYGMRPAPTPSQTASPKPRLKLDQDRLRIAQIYIFSLAKGSDPVTSRAFSPSGSLLVAAFGDSHVQTWNLQTGQPVHRYPQGGAVAFSRDGKFLAIASNAVHLWQLEGNLELKQLTMKVEIDRLCFKEGGQLVGVGLEGLNVWDVHRGELIVYSEHGGWLPREVVISQDCEREVVHLYPD
jgi:WD40 repeat protein